MDDDLPLLKSELAHTRAGILLREYQTGDHDDTFRLYDGGCRGTLTRGFTSCGKTLMSCVKADTWLNRSDANYVLILSYEEQLVNQFVEEIVDYLGVTPGIEMADLKVTPGQLPRIIVASRASLLYRKPPTEDQITELRKHGIEPGPLPREKVGSILKAIKRGVCMEEILFAIEELKTRPEANERGWSRVHKFDWRLNWMIVADEAHKFAHQLKSVGPIHEWFAQNPNSWWQGQTATPKRSDGVSIGHKMFPGIALDYPLYKPDHPCGVLDGWAVPYVQRYIKVEGVDFKSLTKVAGDFKEDELGRVLGKESTLASLIEPMLDMVDDRRTLIFSPTIQMAKDVARYINARSRCVCTCGQLKWHPTLLIGDGAKCPKCGRLSESGDIDKHPEQAYEIDGETPDRAPIYKAHQNGEFQFLSVCGLCREGYNDREIACATIFRPVSKAASSLAEQMKGRSCRVLKGIVDVVGLTKEQRLAAIAASRKPNSLIIDLVGCTGLADCASTVQIYGEGLPDEIQSRAETILAEQGLDGEIDVQGAIEQAKREDAENRDRIRQEREAAEQKARELAERRAKAGAEVQYSVHERGCNQNGTTDPREATEGMFKLIKYLGLSIHNTYLTKKQAGRIIRQLKSGLPLEEVAHTNRLAEWEPQKPSEKEQYRLDSLHADWATTPWQASMVMKAYHDQPEFFARQHEAISKCENPDELTHLARNVAKVNRTMRLDQAAYAQLIEAGRQRRCQLTPTEF